MGRKAGFLAFSLPTPSVGSTRPGKSILGPVPAEFTSRPPAVAGFTHGPWAAIQKNAGRVSPLPLLLLKDQKVSTAVPGFRHCLSGPTLAIPDSTPIPPTVERYRNRHFHASIVSECQSASITSEHGKQTHPCHPCHVQRYTNAVLVATQAKQCINLRAVRTYPGRTVGFIGPIVAQNRPTRSISQRVHVRSMDPIAYLPG